MKRHVIRITGRVQGVFLRQGAKQLADKLGLAGFARNEPDGSVYIEVEGEESALDKFLEWCKKGPERAEVEKVAYNTAQPAGHKGFTAY